MAALIPCSWGADGGAGILFPAFAQFRSDRLRAAECGFQHFAGTLLLRFRFRSKSFASVKRLFIDGSLSRMFRPPSGSAMLMLLFVVRTTSNLRFPAPQ